MSDIPKFLSCDNFMDDEDGEYVLHTQAPKFLAKWNEEDEGFDIVAEFDDISKYYGGNEDKVTSLFEQMATWYSDYDEWLDQDSFEEEG